MVYKWSCPINNSNATYVGSKENEISIFPSNAWIEAEGETFTNTSNKIMVYKWSCPINNSNATYVGQITRCLQGLGNTKSIN